MLDEQPAGRDRTSASRSERYGKAPLVLVLIVASALARLALSSLIGPTVDESYAVVMGRRLALSYYDHPPFLFWIPGLAARIAQSEDAFVVRLPFVLMFMGTTWFLYRLSAFLFDESSGLWTAVCLNLVLFFTLSVGGWVLPDGPLLFWSALAALFLARATIGAEADSSPRGDDPQWHAWAGFGLSAGLALLSKYHAVFLLAGAGLFLMTSRPHRRWLLRPQPYVALALSIVVFLPVIVWNFRHDWASLRFQGGRAVPLEAERSTPLLSAVAGQAAWMLPWMWVPLLLVMGSALARGPRDARRWLLLCLGIGPVVFFTVVAALGRRGLPHWQAPGYFMALPLLGASVARRISRGDRTARAWAYSSAVGLAATLALLCAQTTTGFLNRAAPGLLARGDPTDDLLAWTPVVHSLHEWGYPKPGVVIAGAIWADAAKLAYALGPEVPVCSVGGDPRGFEFVRSQKSLVGRSILVIARRRAGEMEPMLVYAPYFARITPLGTVAIDRRGQPGIAVSAYLGEDLLRPPAPSRRIR